MKTDLYLQIWDIWLNLPSMNDEGRKNIGRDIEVRKKGLENGSKCPRLGLGDCPWPYCDLYGKPKPQGFCSP